jgi:hypothetical protein
MGAIAKLSGGELNTFSFAKVKVNKLNFVTNLH